jgi:hypothetical protein
VETQASVPSFSGYTGVANDGTKVGAESGGTLPFLIIASGTKTYLPTPGAGLGTAGYISASGGIVGGQIAPTIPTAVPYVWFLNAEGVVTGSEDLPCSGSGDVYGGSEDGLTLTGSCNGQATVWTRSSSTSTVFTGTGILAENGTPCTGIGYGSTDAGLVTGNCGSIDMRYQVGSATSITANDLFAALGDPVNHQLTNAYWIGTWLDPNGNVENISLDQGSLILAISPQASASTPEPGNFWLLAFRLFALMYSSISANSKDRC